MRIEKEIISEIKKAIDSAERIAITCHVSPDGDAIGSSLGLMHFLNQLGKKVSVITPDTPPHTLDFLPGSDKIIVASRHPEKSKSILKSADTVFCLDYNSLYRIDRMRPFIEESNAKKILIDHHLSPDIPAHIILSKPEMSSTCELVIIMIEEMGMSELIDLNGAECLYTGMLTDTGNFSYNSNDPDIYRIIAEFLKKGLDKDMIYEKAWNTNSENRLKICGYALSEKLELFKELNLSLIALNNEELKRFDYSKGDTEGLVNKPLSIPGINWSVFMRADEEDFVKISMRSKGDFAVNDICEKLFNGGGHKNAAGGEYYGSLEDAIKKFKDYVGL